MIISLIKSSASYGVIDAVTKSLMVFAIIFLAEVFSLESIGRLEILLTLTAFIGMVVNCGLNNASHRFYWESNCQRYRSSVVTSGLISMMMISFIVFLIFSLLFLFFSNFFIRDVIKINFILFLFLFIYASLLQILSYTQDITRLHFSFKKFTIISFGSKFISVFFSLLVIFFMNKAIDYFIYVQTLVFLIFLPFSIYLIKYDFQLSYFDIKKALKLVKFGFPFIFASFSYWVIGALDKWMISYFLDLTEVAIYSIAFRMGLLLTIITSGIGLAWSPVAVKIKEDFPDKYNIIYGEVLVCIILVMVLATHIMVLFSGEILAVLADGIYLKSQAPFIFLAIGIVFFATTQVTAIGVGLSGHTIILAIGAFFASLVNFLLNLVLIDKYGIIGASVASALSYLFMTCVYFVFSQRYFPIILKKQYLMWLCFYCALSSLLVFVLLTISGFFAATFLKLVFILASTIVVILLVRTMEVFRNRALVLIR